MGELNSQRGLDSRWLAIMFFCKGVIFVATLLLIIHIHYVYFNIFNIAESWHKTIRPYLAIQPSNVVLVGRSIVNIALLSMLIAV